jgi:hypothetical protein
MDEDRDMVGRSWAVGIGIAAMLAVGTGAAGAQDASSWREIETKYLFGFTTGSGIGLEGEKEFTLESIARFGKRDGRYRASETKIEYEFTPSQFVQIEFGALASTHEIHNVTDLDDRRQFFLEGAFAEFRYLLLERTQNNPLSVTVSFEPTGRTVDETSGDRVRNFEFETKINADIEVIKNRLYAGFNTVYEPEVTTTSDHVTEREAKLSQSAALALRVLPNLVLGTEAWYLRHYDAANLTNFTGDAVLVGPTLYYALTSKMFVAAAWNAQVWGREVGNPAPYNFAEFQRHRVKLKFALEF